MKTGSILAKFMHWLDQITLKKSQHVIVDTRAHGDYFISEFGAKPDDVEVLYLNADKSIYHSRGIKKPEKYSGKYIVTYFGSALPLQGIDIIMQAALMCRADENIQFIIIGPVNKRYEKIESPNILYIDWLPQNTLAEYLEWADLCLAGHFNGEIDKAKRTIPGKAYIYEAMGKPMILGDSPANHERYQERQTGIWFAPMGDSAALAEKIKELAKQWENR